MANIPAQTSSNDDGAEIPIIHVCPMARQSTDASLSQAFSARQSWQFIEHYNGQPGIWMWDAATQLCYALSPLQWKDQVGNGIPGPDDAVVMVEDYYLASSVSAIGNVWGAGTQHGFREWNKIPIDVIGWLNRNNRSQVILLLGTVDDFCCNNAHNITFFRNLVVMCRLNGVYMAEERIFLTFRACKIYNGRPQEDWITVTVAEFLIELVSPWRPLPPVPLNVQLSHPWTVFPATAQAIRNTAENIFIARIYLHWSTPGRHFMDYSPRMDTWIQVLLRHHHPGFVGRWLPFIP